MKEQHYAQGKKIQTDCPVTMQLAHTSPIHSQYPRNQLADDDDMMVRNSGFYRRQAVDPEVPWWNPYSLVHTREHQPRCAVRKSLPQASSKLDFEKSCRKYANEFRNKKKIASNLRANRAICQTR
uniref:Uncharacterized protein n=1 Tax=Physcomitrium patens TaxID=3218 RepID=A0A2K1KN56_PHYPA|nr:hypothetical protein PHYPA_006107 [Physcomitrium patens]